jgi:hypothetical protein
MSRALSPPSAMPALGLSADEALGLVRGGPADVGACAAAGGRRADAVRGHAAREPAYRLFQVCERRKAAQEALPQMRSWPTGPISNSEGRPLGHRGRAPAAGIG